MRYRIAEHKEKRRWNEFISSSPNGHLLQSFEWGDVKRRDGWIPIRLLVEEGTQIKAAISMLKHKLPLIDKSIFYAPRGPTLDYNNTQCFDLLMNAIKDAAAFHKAIYLQVDSPVSQENSTFSNYLIRQGFVNLKKKGRFRLGRSTFVLRSDISKDVDSLFMSLHSKFRYNIRLAQRRGVRILDRNQIEDLRIFYALLEDTSIRQNFPIRSFQYFRALWVEFSSSGVSKLLLAYYDGKPIAAVLLFAFGQICWYLYGASSRMNRNVMAPHLLHWEAIKWAKSKGCHYYDLGGIPSPNPSPDLPGHGLYRFKMAFNPELYVFPKYYYIFRPTLYTFWDYGESVLQRLGPLYLKCRKSINSIKKLF